MQKAHDEAAVAANYLLPYLHDFMHAFEKQMHRIADQFKLEYKAEEHSSQQVARRACMTFERDDKVWPAWSQHDPHMTVVQVHQATSSVTVRDEYGNLYNMSAGDIVHRPSLSTIAGA